MKYSEFKAEVEKMGYTFFENKYEVRILDKGACKLIIIDKTDTHVIDPNNVGYITLSHKDKTELLDLACELAKTPLAEREEEEAVSVEVGCSCHVIQTIVVSVLLK